MPYMLIDRKQLIQPLAPFEAAALAFIATLSAQELMSSRIFGGDADGAQCIFLFLARDGTKSAIATHEALSDNADEGACGEIRFDAHIEQSCNRAGGIVGMQRAEDKVAGKRSVNCDFGGFMIADFADHDDVRVLTDDVSQSIRKSE